MKESVRTIVRIVLRQSLHTICIQRISVSLLAIRSLEFEVVSDAHELNAICSKFLFQPSPIVTSFHIVILVIDGTHNIRAENHHLLCSSSQTARTSRSLKNLIDFLLITTSLFSLLSVLLTLALARGCRGVLQGDGIQSYYAL